MESDDSLDDDFSLLIEELSQDTTQSLSVNESTIHTTRGKTDSVLLNGNINLNGDRSIDSMGVLEEMPQPMKHSNDGLIDGKEREKFESNVSNKNDSNMNFKLILSNDKTAIDRNIENSSIMLTESPQNSLNACIRSSNFTTDELENVHSFNTAGNASADSVVASDHYDVKFPENKKRKIASVEDIYSMSVVAASDEDGSNSVNTAHNNVPPSPRASVARKRSSGNKYKRNTHTVISEAGTSRGHELPDPSSGLNGDTINDEIKMIERIANGGDIHRVNLNFQCVGRDALKETFERLRPKLTRNQLEDMLILKICEAIHNSESSEISELKRCNIELQQKEKQRKQICESMEKQLNQLMGVLKIHNDKIDKGHNVAPTMITRSVGLQVVLDPSAFASVNGNSGSLNAGTPFRDKCNSFCDPIIDLTDKDDKDSCAVGSRSSNSYDETLVSAVVKKESSNTAGSVNGARMINQHSPSPSTVVLQPRDGALPPGKPNLKIVQNETGVSLSWAMEIDPGQAKIMHYEIYVHQQTDVSTSSEPWQLVGQVDAMPLPMECTLTQLFSGHKYYFSVRAIDEYGRYGPYSNASDMAL